MPRSLKQAAALRDRQKALEKQLEEEKESWEEQKQEAMGEVTPEDVAEIVSMWTGVPVSRLTEEEGKKLLRLEETLHQRIVGQEEAVSAVSRAIRRGRSGLKEPHRPIGSFLFFGTYRRGENRALPGIGRSPVWG